MTYELLSGRHPYNREQADVAEKNNLKPKKIKHLTSSQWKALANALVLKRNNRTQSIELFLHELSAQKSKKSLILSLSLLAIILPASTYFFFQYSSPSTKTNLLPATDTKPPAINKISSAELAPVELASNPNSNENKALEKFDPTVTNTDILLATNQQVFQIGDKLFFEFLVKKPMYVSIAVITSENEISMLFPNPFQLDNYCLPNKQYHIPPREADFDINIEGPVGTDQVIAIISDQAIIDDPFSQYENLDQLKSKLTKAGLQYTLINYQITD